jgi:glutamine amidotransferase PdxT
MQLGAESVFVGSGIFKSSDPAARARAIVRATTHFRDASIVLEAVFIRAPRSRRTGAGVKVVASLKDEPVLVSEGNILAATFHPELTEDVRTHSLFLEMIKRS